MPPHLSGLFFPRELLSSDQNWVGLDTGVEPHAILGGDWQKGRDLLGLGSRIYRNGLC